MSDFFRLRFRVKEIGYTKTEPSKKGNYTVEAYLWKGWEKPRPLTKKLKQR